jgi:hypothetical protein
VPIRPTGLGKLGPREVRQLSVTTTADSRDLMAFCQDRDKLSGSVENLPAWGISGVRTVHGQLIQISSWRPGQSADPIDLSSS